VRALDGTKTLSNDAVNAGDVVSLCAIPPTGVRTTKEFSTNFSRNNMLLLYLCIRNILMAKYV
jgi:hypothetical protein